MKLVEDRVEIFMSKGSENISEKINWLLWGDARDMEKVIDVRMSTSPVFTSS